MKTLMQKLFGTRAPATPHKTAPSANHDLPSTIQEGSENAIRRQLVQVLLRDMLRRHGIPPHWIELQMLVVSSESRGAGLYVRLLIKQWDARLMTYAYALQNALLVEITRFEPRASDWLHGISWQFEMGDACPYPSLPDKSFWLEPTEPASHVVTPAPVAPVAEAVESTLPATEDDARQDLERLFQIRDQEIGKQTDGDHAPAGYEKTQPSPL
ncbi:MAG: hypothetical protein ACYCZ6_05190 [Polaromonas sp.]